MKNQMKLFTYMTKPFVLFVLLFTLGVGNVWADDWEAVWNAWLKCDFNGSPKDFTGKGGYEYQYNPTMTGDADGILYDLGTLDAGDFVVTYLSWKIGDNWACDNTYSYMWYTINDGSPVHSSGQWEDGQNNSDGYYPKTSSMSWTIARYTDASGVYIFKNSFYTHFHWSDKGYRQADLNNGGYGYKWKYRVAPPAVDSIYVTGTGALAGDGSRDNPYIVAYGGTLQIDITSASQAHTDANSSAQYSVDNSNWGTATANTRKTIDNITSTDVANWMVYAKFHNGTASLTGAQKGRYVYYRAENRYNITATASPATGGTVTPATATLGGQYSGGDITASPYIGYKFNGWTRTSGSGSFVDASSAETKFKPTAASTVQASFARMYAYIEANLQVYDETRSSRTKTGDDWTDASTAIPMAYDDANHRFYLHTYSTPAELAQQLNNRDAYFYIRTSTSSSSLDGGTKYYANGSGANQSLSSEGSANKKAIKKDDSSNSFKFTGSEDGYVILYFDGSSVWYELECKVTYDGNDKTGGTTPTDATYYAKGATVTVAAEPASWAKTGYTFGGWNKANDGSGTNYTAGTGTFSIDVNTTLYAKWTQTVTLHDNNGEADNGSVDVIYNATSTTSLDKPTKTGYSVEGFYAEVGCTNKVMTDAGALVDYSGYVSSGKWVHDAATTLYTKWTPNEYTVRFENLDADAGHKGSLDTTVTFNDTIHMKGPIEKPSKIYYDFGGYYISTDKGKTLTNLTHQLIDANGNWIKDVSPYTGNDGNNQATWICAGDTVLYAKWTETLHTITIASGGNGTVSPESVNVGGVTSSGEITATPNTGYHFRDWALPDGGIVTTHEGTSSTDAAIHIKATASGTITANFDPNTYVIRLEDKGADKDHKGTPNVTATYNATTNLTSSIDTPQKKYYTFDGYYISNDGGVTLTDTKLIDKDGNWIKGVSGYTGTSGDNATWVCAGDTTLYAKWTEITHTVSIAVSPAEAGSVQVNSSDVTQQTAGYTIHTGVMTAVLAHPAWKFKEWQGTDSVHFDLETYSRNGPTMTATVTDNDQTITAVFEPRYTLVGKIYDSESDGGMPGMSNYTVVFPPSDSTCTRNLLANTKYQVEIHDLARGANMGRSGCASGCVLEENTSLVMENQDNVVFLNTTGAGYYIFKITNINGSGNPTLTVLRPHQMHMGHKRVDIDGTSHSDDTGGTLTASTGGNSLVNGDWYNYGANITYTASAQSGYTLTWYTNDSYTSEFPLQPAATWPHNNVTGDENVYAKFTEKSTAVTFSATNGKVQIASTDKANTTVGITTSREITAVPNTGYSFSSWTVPGGADFSVESTSSATTTLSGLGAGTAGTLTANFTENMHDVTVKAGSGGSVSSDPALSDGKVTIGITTSATLTATPANAAWVFKNWTGDIDDGITIASGSATSATITINATADSKSITANFEPRYGLHGSLANDTPGGMPGWAGDGADFAVSSFSGIGEGDGKGVDLRCARTLEPNKEYKFRIYDRAADGRWGYSSSVTLGAGESLELSTYGDESGKDVKIYTVGYGTYTFKITNMYDNGDDKYYPKVTVDRPTSYQFNMGWTEGGTVSAYTRNGATPTNYPIVNGQYVSAGDSIVFAAVPAAGYSFEGWHSSDAYNSQFATDPNMHISNINATVNAYAKFVPIALTFTNNDGSGDGNWNTASNWSPECVPTLGHDVTIQAPVVVAADHATAKSIVLDQNSHTGKLTIQANKGLEVVGTITRTTDGSNSLATREEDLVLESSTAGNASLIFNNSNSCAATVQMYSKGYIDGETWNWQYVGTPFTGSIPLYNYYGSWMYKWNNGGWEVVHGGDELTPFAGYCLTQNSATTHVMGGTLVPTTSKSVTMAASTDMVLANSWTAPISIASFDIEGGDATFTSTPATVYLFNTGMAEDGSEEGIEAGTYISVPINSAPYTGNGLIAPMQGFFVTTNGVGGAAGSITLNYNDLVRPAGSHTDIVAGPMKVRKQEETKPDVMKIRANGALYNDRVVILAREDFSEGFDNGWDGEKMSFGEVAPSVYVINEQGGYDAVSAIPSFEGTVVGFRAGANNSCTMSFEYDGDETLYLNDLQAQMSTLISEENNYTFTTSSNDSEVRFIISATPIQKVPTSIDNGGLMNDAMVKVRKLIINDHVYIIRSGRMYGVDGQMIK